ncbi:MAG: trypsin-like peptidase domain-containing protein, partial [bacterium]|nr:trypsin-like peptidase domain-containing protein [bacterium]
MSLYDLPKFNRPKLKIKYPKPWKNRFFWFIISSIFVSSFFGFLAGMVSGSFFYLEVKDYLSELNIDFPESQAVEKEYIPQTSQEEKIIRAVEKVSPSVVSIVITKDVPVFEQYFYSPLGDPFFSIPQYRQKGTEKQEIGGGTGFIVSGDGLILTNKHVVLDEEADYTVFTNDGKSYPAKVLASDPFQDLAILKIDQEKIVDEEGRLNVTPFPIVELGDSDGLQIGQTVVA